jgi:hypothetical protein
MRIKMAKTEERRYIETWLRKEQTKDEKYSKWRITQTEERLLT